MLIRFFAIILFIVSIVIIQIKQPAHNQNFIDSKENSIQLQNSTTLESYIDSLVMPMIDSLDIAGISIGLIKNGKIRLVKSYGFADLARKIRLKKNMIFPIASVSKTLTANAILQLAEKDKIKLDDDLTKYIDFDTKGKLITIRDLLNHTSGIKDFTESDIPTKLSGKAYDSEDLLRLLEGEQFDFQPGEAMDYNNSGFYLLALIVEKASGLSFEEYMNKNIFKPLRMKSTTNGYANNTKEKLVKGYNMDREGKLNLVKAGDFRMAMGAGSLCSNVIDLLKWQINLHHSKKLLSKQSYSSMISRNRLKKGGPTNYGLGVEINQHNGHRVISHNGVMNGYLTDSRYFPDADLSIVVLINTLGKRKPMEISNIISNYYLEKRDPTQENNSILSSYVGFYKGVVMGNNVSMNVLIDNGQLTVENRGNKIPLNYIGNSTWLANDGYTYLFLKNKMQVNAPKLSIIFKKEIAP